MFFVFFNNNTENRRFIDCGAKRTGRELAYIAHYSASLHLDIVIITRLCTYSSDGYAIAYITIIVWTKKNLKKKNIVRHNAQLRDRKLSFRVSYDSDNNIQVPGGGVFFLPPHRSVPLFFFFLSFLLLFFIFPAFSSTYYYHVLSS